MLFQCELVCVHVHLLQSWSTTIKVPRIQVKSYRLLFIFLHSKEYISLRTDRTVWNSAQKLSITGLIAAISFSPWKGYVTFRAINNWCCHYDHYVNVCQKNTPHRGNSHVSKYFQLQRLWSTEKLNLNPIRISTLHFKILRKTNLYSHPMLEKQRQQDPSSNTVRSSQWDWEDLEFVDTTDPGAAWREEQVTSTKSSL